MKLEVRYLFSISGTNFNIYQSPECMGMFKILAHGIRIQNNPQTHVEIFWIFTDFHRIMWFESSTSTHTL